MTVVKKSSKSRQNYLKITRENQIAMRMLIFFLVFIFAVIIARSIKIQHDLNRLYEEKIELERQIADEEKRQSQILEEKEELYTEEYIRQRAKEMGLVDDNEIIFKSEK